jgi:hypothetical protein
VKHSFWIPLTLFIFFNSIPKDLYGQTWVLIKEKDGIKIFTRKESNSSLKSFKGETTFPAKVEKLSLLLGNGKNFDWWGKDIRGIKVLAHQENKFNQYYLIYNVPWPFSDRDLVVETTITEDPVTGERTYLAKPLLNAVPEAPDLVRIRKYWQKWSVRPMENGYVHVSLEGFVDPGGNIPSWLYNLVITETPLAVMRALRERALSDKPVIN